MLKDHIDRWSAVCLPFGLRDGSRKAPETFPLVFSYGARVLASPALPPSRKARFTTIQSPTCTQNFAITADQPVPASLKERGRQRPSEAEQMGAAAAGPEQIHESHRLAVFPQSGGGVWGWPFASHLRWRALAPSPTPRHPGQIFLWLLKNPRHTMAPSRQVPAAREPAFRSAASPPTFCLSTQGNRRPSWRRASPQEFRCCHSGPGDGGRTHKGWPRAISRSLALSSTWSSAALQDKEERFYQPNVLLTNA